MANYQNNGRIGADQFRPPANGRRNQQLLSAQSNSPVRVPAANSNIEIKVQSQSPSPRKNNSRRGINGFPSGDQTSPVIEIDYQAVEQTIRATEETPGKKVLDAVLPKLAKRIQQVQQVGEPSKVNEEAKQKTGTPSSQSQESPQRRVSVTARGSVSFKPSLNMPPEVADLRNRDIEPDENSAADQALKAAAFLAQHSGTASGGRRESMFKSPHDHQEVEGREIQQDHAQYALTYGMMLGIRVTTGRRDIDLDLLSSSKSLSVLLEEQELTSQDYDYTTELIFKPEGNSTPPFPTPPHKLSFTFMFKDYMTNVFRAVRALSNIDEADYMLSLAGDFNYIEFIANSKSGQFFFYSHDGKYMIKTQSKEESKLLRKIMPLYIQHLTIHPDSLLVRFYGMHRVKMKSLRSNTYFIIMSSVFNTPKPINIKYDLKGSTVGRLTSPEDCREGAVQKDLNLMASGNRIRLGEPNIDIFHETLKADVNFLKNLNIMDYSLLLGIHQGSNRRGTTTRRRSSGVVLSSKSSVRLNSSQGGATSSSNSGPETALPPSEGEEGGLSYSPNSSPLRKQSASGREIGDLNEDFANSMLTGSSLFNSHYGGIRSTPETNEIYFMGIIDILQVYNTGKKMENIFKGFTYDRKQLSAVDPNLYADRMLNFIMQHTDYPEIMEKRKIAQKAGKINNKALHRTNSRNRNLPSNGK